MMNASSTDDVRYEAEVNWKAIRRLLLAALGVAAFLAGRSYYLHHLEQQASALEDVMFRVLQWMSIDEVEALIGRPPDEVQSGEAVFAHGGGTAYDVSNPLAKQYGPPKTYTWHHWRNAPVSVAVFTDENGEVFKRVNKRDAPSPTMASRLSRWLGESVERLGEAFGVMG